MICNHVLSIVCDGCDRALEPVSEFRAQVLLEGVAATFVYADDARRAAQQAGWLTDNDLGAFCPNCITDETKQRLTEHVVGAGSGLPICIYCHQIVRYSASKSIVPLVCPNRVAKSPIPTQGVSL